MSAKAQMGGEREEGAAATFPPFVRVGDVYKVAETHDTKQVKKFGRSPGRAQPRKPTWLRVLPLLLSYTSQRIETR